MGVGSGINQPFGHNRNNYTGPNSTVVKSLANGLIGTRFAS